MNTSSFKQFWKTGGSLAALVTVLVILVGINIIASRMQARTDLTQEKVYTLSEGTRAVLQKLDQDVVLKFFFSGTSAEIPGPFKTFAQQVGDLLKEYTRVSNGRVAIEKYSPEPDSEAEELAQWYGISGQPIGPMGPVLYLGIAVVAGDRQAVMPVIDPRTEETLEYNLTRLIYRVAHARKPVIGVMSSLPVLGSDIPPYMLAQMNTPQQKPWVALNELKQDYEVRSVTPQTAAIDTNIDTLIVIHPREFSDAALFAIDQYLLQGGRVLAFVDPLCAAAIESSPQQRQFGAGPNSSDLNRLVSAWGLSFDAGQVVADIEATTMIRGRDGRAEQSPLYLNLVATNLSRSEIATASLDGMLMPFAGVFSGEPKSGIKLTPLISTSERSQTIGAMMAQFGSDAVRRDFKAGMKRLNLAVRLSGTFPTAFPDGRPAAKEKEEGAAEEPAGPTNFLAQSSRPGTVVLIGDVDLIYDAFCVRSMNFFGYEAQQPINDNISFLANIVEQLSGSSDLISIRSRGKTDRPFTRVLALARNAQERWMLEERDIEQKLQNVQERLNQLQSQKDNKQSFILSPEQEAEVAKFKQEMVANRRQLKDIRKRLREGIEALGMRVKIANILLMPLLVAVAGIGFYFVRRTKSVR